MLIIRIIDAPAAPSGKALLLCDERGEPLPNQVSSVVHNDLGGQTIDIRFAIDGEKVRFE